MKVTREKRVKRTLKYYKYNFGFREPFQVLIDNTFVAAALNVSAGQRDTPRNSRLNLLFHLPELVRHKSAAEAVSASRDQATDHTMRHHGVREAGQEVVRRCEPGQDLPRPQMRTRGESHFRSTLPQVHAEGKPLYRLYAGH